MDGAKHICIVLAGHFSATQGGAQYQAQVLVNQLAASNRFRATYVTRHVAPDFQPDGYAIHKIAHHPIFRRFGFSIDAAPLYMALRNLQPDVIYQRGLLAHTGIAAHYARRNNTKMVFNIASDFDVMTPAQVQEEGVFGLSTMDKRIGEYGLRHAHEIVAQTNFQKQMLKTNYGRDATVIRNFHPAPKEQIQRTSEKFRVLWIANFKPNKRPQLFVELADMFRDRTDIQFTMLGRPGDSRQYAELHRKIDSLPNLCYLGEVSQDRVNEELACSHLLVSTSLVEGFSNTYIQAWMRGVPVISVSVNPDNLFDDKKIGICVGAPEQLGPCVASLLEDRTELEAMSAHTKAFAMQEHSISNAQSLIDLMDRC